LTLDVKSMTRALRAISALGADVAVVSMLSVQLSICIKERAG
jgi:hypothetical protein